MSFFKKLVEGEDLEEHKGFSSEIEEISEKDLEKLYLKLYMKIARDFTVRSDYQIVIEELINYLDLESDDISLYSVQEALALGYEYKDILEERKVNTYKDLINLDE